MSRASEALDIIKNIELSHIEQERDENFEGESEHTLTEVQDGTVGDNFGSEIETIEKALRALEIIKNKKVDVVSIMELPEAENVIWYNCSFMGVLCENGRMLTKEEYELLREVLL